MAHATLNSSSETDGSTRVSGNIFAAFFSWLKHRAQILRDLDRLDSMSDWELEDIGLNRGDIRRTRSAAPAFFDYWRMQQ